SSTQQRVTVVDSAPNVVLSRTPPTGRPPLTVTVDASRSTDTDATPIVSYTFNFGDGSPLLGPQASPIAVHTYVISGNFKIRVTVTDSVGNSSSSQVPVNVRN